MRVRAALSALALALVCHCALAQELMPEVQGRVLLPGPETGIVASRVEVILTALSGSVRTSAVLVDGSFAFLSVAEGVYTLDVAAKGLVYPTTVVEIKSTASGMVAQATTPSLPSALQPATSYPILIRPTGKAEYFMKPSSFDIIAFMKTPYGLMIGFMIFSVFILPKLKVDPEEEESAEQPAAVEGSPTPALPSGSRAARKDE